MHISTADVPLFLSLSVTQYHSFVFFFSIFFFFPTQVNIIPVIAKADTVSKSELDKLKIKIMSELVSNGVQIYQFPTEDEAVAEINSSMNVSPGNTHTHLHETRPVLCIVEKLSFSTIAVLPRPAMALIPDQFSLHRIKNSNDFLMIQKRNVVIGMM